MKSWDNPATHSHCDRQPCAGRRTHSGDRLALGECRIGRHTKRALYKHLLSTYDVPQAGP